MAHRIRIPFLVKAPHLGAEWHWSKNGSLLPDDISFGSERSVWWICKDGHEWEASPNDRTSMKSGCAACFHRHSKAELALYELIKERHPDALSGRRGLLNNPQFELDVFVPSLRKAVEYDGKYWHSTPDAIDRDARKDRDCREAGIPLMRISSPSEYSAVLDWLGNCP